MKKLLIVSFLIFAVCELFAQDTPKATLNIWTEGFATSQGAIIYPQYAWGMKTSGGNVNGFGFVESTPNERMFSNHLVWYTPPKINWLSIHTETGGFPAHSLGFFQLGPRVNVTEAIPKLKKPLARLFVTALPRFVGIRPKNILVGGATNSVKVKGFAVWVEGYRRFFPDGSGYGEYWLMTKPNSKSPVSFGVIGHHVTGNSYIGVGLRVSFF